MTNIAIIDFIDVSYMAAALQMRHRTHFDDDVRRQERPGSAHHDTKMILLRGPKDPDAWFEDVPYENAGLLAEWPSARQVLDRVTASLVRAFGVPPVIGKVMVEQLKAGGFVDWHADDTAYAQKHNRFHLCLVPSPGAWLHSGGEAAVAPMGNLLYFNNHVLHSALNVGPCDRVHLIVDARVPEKN